MSDFLFGLMVTGIGMAVIFILMTVLVGFVYLFSFIINYKDKHGKKAKTLASGLDPQIVAAISAGLTVYFEEENKNKNFGSEMPSVDFIVKNIKKR